MSIIQEGEMERISTVFDALGNVTRVKTLLLVYESRKPLHITAVANALKMDYAALYRHVKVLQRSELLEVYEVGRSRVIYLKNGDLIREIVRIAKKISETE